MSYINYEGSETTVPEEYADYVVKHPDGDELVSVIATVDATSGELTTTALVDEQNKPLDLGFEEAVMAQYDHTALNNDGELL